MWEIWANYLLPKALKSCPKSNKSLNLVSLTCLPNGKGWSYLDKEESPFKNKLNCFLELNSIDCLSKTTLQIFLLHG